MFANDTNLFTSYGNIKYLFNNLSLDLNKIFVGFKANKLSRNEEKTEYTFFQKSLQKDNIPLKLPMLAISGKVIERTTSIKFFDILLDEKLSWKNHTSIVENNVSKNIGILYLSWKNHISIVENNVSKNIGILYKARNIVSKGGLYFSVHIFLLFIVT